MKRPCFGSVGNGRIPRRIGVAVNVARARAAMTMFVFFAGACIAPAAAAPRHPSVIDMVNAERTRAGMSLLAEDPVLDRFALSFARQMLAAGVFGHTLPNGVSFEDRVRYARLPVGWAAENLAEDSDPRSAQAALVRSAPHYANMMSRFAHRMGAAVVRATDGLAVVVEEFSD